MDNQTWVSILILASATVLFSGFIIKKIKKYSEYPLHYSGKLILGGGGLLFCGGILNRILTWDLVQVTFPGWLTVFKAAEIFGYLVGGGTLVIGFLKWYRVAAETKRNATRRLKQLTCLHSLLSAINRLPDMDQMLKAVLEDILNILGYKMGVIFKPTFDSPEMKIVAYEGIPPEKLYSVFDLYAKNSWYLESSQSRQVTSTSEVSALPENGTLFSDEDQISSFACVPIKFSGKLLGLLGLYDSKPDRFSYQETQFLTCLGETLGLSIQQNLASHRNKKRRSYLSVLGNISDAAREGVSLPEVFPQVAAEIKRIIDFDQISLFLNRGTSTNPEVITIGKSGGVLVERRKGSSGIDNIMAKVMYTKRAWVDHIPNHSNDKMSRFLGDNCGIKSQIILPLVQGESTYGALSLGHQETGFYSSGDEKWLKPLVLVLSGLVFEQVQNERLARKEFLDRSLSDFEKRLVVEDSVYSLIKDITEKLTTEMPKSFVRFSLLNQRKDQLVSFATHQIRSEGIDLNKEERFPLEKLPWHRLTLTAKKPMLINQEDPESYMSKNEAGLIMDERIKSGILIPLLLEDVAVGVISVGEMRSWSRVPLTPAEIGYIKHRTNQACVALKKGLLSRLNARLKEKLKKNEIPEKTFPASSIDQNPFFNLSYKINNTLTAIRGSAELLKFSLSDLKPDKLKYLKTIENGADRIHSCLEEFSYSPHVHTKEEKLVPAQKETVSS